MDMILVVVVAVMVKLCACERVENIFPSVVRICRSAVGGDGGIT